MPTYIAHWRCEPNEWPVDRSTLIETWTEMLGEGKDDLQSGTVKFAGWVSNAEGYGIVEAPSKAAVIRLCAKFWPMVHNDISEIVPLQEASAAIIAGTNEGWEKS